MRTKGEMLSEITWHKFVFLCRFLVSSSDTSVKKERAWKCASAVLIATVTYLDCIFFVLQYYLWTHSVHQQEPFGVCCPRGRLLSDQRGEQHLLLHPIYHVFFSTSCSECFCQSNNCRFITCRCFVLTYDSGSFQPRKTLNVALWFVLTVWSEHQL